MGDYSQSANELQAINSNRSCKMDVNGCVPCYRNDNVLRVQGVIESLQYFLKTGCGI